MDRQELDCFLRRITPREQYYLDNPGSPSPRYEAMERRMVAGQEVLWFPIPDLERDDIHLRKDSRFTDVPNHMHANVNVNFIYSGHCDYVINKTPVTLYQGDLCIFDLGVVRRKQYLGENDIVINLNMSHDFFSNSFLRKAGEQNIFSDFLLHVLSARTPSHNHYMIFRAGEDAMVYELFLALLAEYFDEDLYGKSMVQGYLQLIFLRLLRLYQQKPDQQIIRISSGGNSSILDMLYYLEKNSASCTLTELAERFGYHPKYVTALFKQMTGLSFKQLQIRERMKHAAALLEKTDTSIQEIAQQTGAGNLSAFYKDFQRQYGMLPSVWRRLHRAEVKFQARSGTAANI